ncbi:hypothetical protein GLAREA_01574 [Glarea lozoyensis ATCC 20868]|uniref:Heterokaryon incompatibility domain-containing protein n=1 Tax=Glarea lozoyensis (strain ATCC 20868 / MF5171) TaxID=1116229 RepID=S3CGN0_GLAL2|nr:uncharacterized protein GLAREA_01574 [Glarea lozoyensis ATCC 20868]EPE25662.1 hypothetical protein GLAREA_01574 [Glarea lozoyensis ATCC 20868]
MWLINTTTLNLECFMFPNVPQYEILSHTWGDEEVSFQQFINLEEAKMKGGFAKIEKTCQLAKASGIKYAWVDTCCIDKLSSAELSESINSMYCWYQRAHVYYAFLSDWRPEYDWVDMKSLKDSELNIEDPAYESAGSDPSARPLRWFTRGWTLQELIASTKIEFYDRT